MKIRYNGPSDAVNVGGFGPHKLNEVKDYPDDAGTELIATSKKQLFEVVEEDPSPESMTVAQLQADLVACGYEAGMFKGWKKADLVALWNDTREGLKTLSVK